MFELAENEKQQGVERKAKPYESTESFSEKYNRYLKKSGINIEARTWLAIAVVLSLFTFAVVGFFAVDFGFVLATLLLDAMLGVPYYVALRKVSALEEDLPDAMRQMATTFRAGGTYEYALKEVTLAEYKELSPEMERVLKEIQGGANLNEALTNFAKRSDSRLVQRTIAILIDATRSGAPLADVFTELSEDIQTLHYIDRERQAKTLMQALFITVAGSVVAPVIFGMVSQIVAFLITVGASSGGQSEQIVLDAQFARDHLIFLMKVYLVFETGVSAAMLSSMRSGRFTKTIIYFPVLLFLAYSFYTLSSVLMSNLLLQAGTAVA